MDAIDLQEKIDRIEQHTKRHAIEGKRDLAAIAKRVDIITEDVPDRRRARAFMISEAMACSLPGQGSWLTDDDLIRRWRHEQLSSIICDPSTTFQEKCALLEIDEDDVLEKAGIVCEGRSPAADALAMYLVATSQVRKGACVE